MDNGDMPPLFVKNSFVHWVKIFITFGISRCAVSLFFMFAAFLQAKKNDSYLVLLKKRAKSLLLPYVLWMSLLVFFLWWAKIDCSKNSSAVSWSSRKYLPYMDCFGLGSQGLGVQAESRWERF